MKNSLLSLVLLSLMTSCNNLGDILLDKIYYTESGNQNLKIEYNYEWDDKSRLYYITYVNEMSGHDA